MDVSNSIKEGHYSFPPYTKPTLIAIAVISTVCAAANAIFCASNAGWIPLGAASTTIAAFPPALPIAFCTIFTATTFFSMVALYILLVKNKSLETLISKAYLPPRSLHNPISNSRPIPLLPSKPQANSQSSSSSSSESIHQELHKSKSPSILEEKKSEKKEIFDLVKVTEAANRGDTEAMYNLGLHLIKENNQAKIGLSWIESADEKQHADAKKWLGQYYFEEAKNYIETNGRLAVETEIARLYKIAADRDHAEAQYKYALCFKDGKGVEKNVQTAIEWLEKSALQGFEPAELDLGKYFAAKESQEEKSKGMSLIKKAAEKNYPKAQYGYGLCLQHGTGVEIDKIESFKWIEKAANQNYPDAKAALGFCYYKGEGCNKDTDKALDLIKQGVLLQSAIANIYFKKLFPNEAREFAL